MPPLRFPTSRPGRSAGLPAVVWALLAGLCGIAALTSLGIAAVVLASRPGDVAPPVPAARGTAVTLPDGRLFASAAALFADVPAGAGPDAATFGCSFRDRDGDPVTPFVSDLTVGEDPVVVGGRTVRPVLLVRRVGRGWTMVCDGPAMDDVAPVYVAAVPDAPAGLVYGLLLPGLTVVLVVSLVLGVTATVLARKAR